MLLVLRAGRPAPAYLCCKIIIDVCTSTLNNSRRDVLAVSRFSSKSGVLFSDILAKLALDLTGFIGVLASLI